MSVLWLAMTGPDRSHLVNSAGVFYRMRDAVTEIDRIGYGIVIRLEFPKTWEPASYSRVVYEKLN